MLVCVYEDINQTEAGINYEAMNQHSNTIEKTFSGGCIQTANTPLKPQ
jgi:hypothetical protein